MSREKAGEISLGLHNSVPLRSPKYARVAIRGGKQEHMDYNRVEDVPGPEARSVLCGRGRHGSMRSLQLNFRN